MIIIIIIIIIYKFIIYNLLRIKFVIVLFCCYSHIIK